MITPSSSTKQGVVINNNSTNNSTNTTPVINPTPPTQEGYSGTSLYRAAIAGASAALYGVYCITKTLNQEPTTEGEKLLFQGAELCTRNIDKITIGSVAAIAGPEILGSAKWVYNNPEKTLLAIGSLGLVVLGIYIGAIFEKFANPQL